MIAIGGLIFFASTTALNIETDGWHDITGLSLKLPKRGSTFLEALVILNVPNPFAMGSNYPGAMFAIDVDGTRLDPIAEFSSAFQSPPGAGRSPTTLVAKVELSDLAECNIKAVWRKIPGSLRAGLDSASLSAIVGTPPS